MDSKAALRGIAAFALLNIAGCGGGGGNGQVISPVQVASVAPDAVNDSTDGTPPVIIDSGILGDVSFSTDTHLRTGVTMNYMVHEAPAATAPKGLIVLISGGYISTDVDSAPVSNVFLSRSAHLFAANGYKVVTIEHPSDYNTYFPDPIPDPGSTGGTIAYDPENSDTWADGEKNYAWYDEYRASQDQRDDLSVVIDIENGSTLPVFLIGYGRGAISAAAAADLNGVGSTPWTVQGVVMVSPATHGGRGFLGNNPVPTNSTINVPVYITYHNDDTCQVFPSNSTTVPQAVSLFREKMIQNGNSIDAVALTGGFQSPTKDAVDGNGQSTYNPCEALTFHGFLGIESGTVTRITDWISGKL